MPRYYVWILGRWARVTRRWRIALVAGFTLALGVASLAGYRQWHYMQHDNRFCTSCHLMVDPFQRFSRSVHAKLECHNCHEGRVPEQLHQLWLTAVESPTAIGRHARVPNEVCAKCHVTGDSTRWKIIAATAGHRMHLESKDPRLRGMRCVECHGVSLHEFAPVDRTCGQSGCHDHNTIHLGGMGQVSELHCTTCHNFLAEARTFAVDSLGTPLTPAAAQCLACHTMQEKMKAMDIGRDPHNGVCGDCHNPHTQTKPQDVNCTNTGCHAGWQRVSFHNGVPHPERCTTCHQPHSWRVEGQQCVRCHANIAREAPSRARRISMTPRSQLNVPTAVADLASTGGAWPDQMPQARRAPPGGTAPRFSHGDHRGQTCSSCHSSRVRHGELLVKSSADCQHCHHGGPERAQCSTCHDVEALGRVTLQTEQTFPLVATRATETRRLPFEHARHQGFACAQCHTNPLSRAPDGAACATCHASHHAAAANCVTCHAATRPIAVHKAADHPNCTSCHGARAASLPSTRAMCLMCHTTQTRHAPGKVCEQCHKVLARS
jgi:nitrate/TMAO reductase-like tetraheme cytochrome c subunit